jgi:acetyl esterase/lipase
LDLFSNWNRINKIEISAPQIIHIPGDKKGSLEIIADLRVPNEPGEFPAVLLLHGENYLGRKSGLIVLLGYHFQKSGWIVLAPDARGFGDSDDPDDIASAESWNAVPDVRRCIDYLYSLPSTNKDSIFVIGHSMGGGHALEAAANDSRIRAMVLIGPPRYKNGIQDSFWKRVKFSAVRDLDEPIASHVYLIRSRKMDIRTYANGFLKKGLLPILLIDGEMEGISNHRHLSQFAKSIGKPLEHFTLKKAGHYCGVYNHPIDGSIYYRPDVLQPFFSTLLDYLTGLKPNP